MMGRNITHRSQKGLFELVRGWGLIPETKERIKSVIENRRIGKVDKKKKNAGS